MAEILDHPRHMGQPRIQGGPGVTSRRGTTLVVAWIRKQGQIGPGLPARSDG